MFGLNGQKQRRRGGPLLIVALALWVPLAGLTAYVVITARESVRAADEHHLEDVARGIALVVDARLGTVTAALAMLAESGTLRAPLDVAGFEREARVVGRMLGGVVALSGPPPGNELLASTSPDPVLMAQRMAAGWVTEALAPLAQRMSDTGKPGLSDLFIAPVQERSVFAIGMPVAGDSWPGRRIWLTIEPATLQEQLREAGSHADVVATIRDGRFRPVAGTARSQAGIDEASLYWVQAALGDRNHAVLRGVDAATAPVIVAAQRLALDPRWIVTVAASPTALASATLEALALPVLGAALTLLCFLAVAWAARRESERQAVSEAEMLRGARDEVAKVHAGLPAVIFLREMLPTGQAGRLLYRAGDIGGVIGWPAEAMQDAFMGDAAESVPETREAMTRFMREGEIAYDWRMRQPDGGWRWLRCQARTLEVLADGTRIAVGYLTNITAEREAQAQAQAARRIASMADMAHGLAHELKQPLQVIALSAETAQVQIGRMAGAATLPPPLRDATARVEEALEGIIRQALRTGDVIEHLRRFARGSAGDTPIGPVGLDVAVEGAMLLIGHAMRRDRIELEIALGDPPPVVLGQTISIEQILVNLLNNARDALVERPADGPRRIRIAGSVLPRDNAALLTVSDTAGGIPAHVLDRLFEPFVTTKPMDRGTGLGLSICRSLAQGMGATLMAENGPEGAVFTLRMPLAPASAARAEASRAA